MNQVHKDLGDSYHKAEAILQVNLPDAPIAFEEFLHISFTGMGAQTADEHATSTHD